MSFGFTTASLSAGIVTVVLLCSTPGGPRGLERGVPDDDFSLSPLEPVRIVVPMIGIFKACAAVTLSAGFGANSF